MIIDLEKIDKFIGDYKSAGDYIDALITSKEELGLTWSEVSTVVYDKFGIDRSREYFRRRAIDISSNKNCDTPMSEDKLRSLRKERMKLSDQIIQNNAILRRISREETLKEIAEDLAKNMSRNKILELPTIDDVSNRSNEEVEAILCLSDWHYGIEVDSYFNTYNTDIARKRINNLLYKTIKACATHKVNKIHVLNLGDLICGRIHLTLRLQSRIDVMTQVMEVSEILAEFLNELSKHVEAQYYDCLDNHSRLEPNKKESLDLESLTRVIPWYLKTRLCDNSEVHFNNNKYGKDIITFDCLGYKVAGVHGHDDKSSNVLDHITLMTHEHFDLMCIAHFHHFSGDEKNESVIVGNGTLMGTDNYAEKLRLSSKPSQNLIVVTPDNVIEDIKRILV